ncbi:MAG: hypothetical protein R6X02_04320 [Enhygromyxa sp.]
MSRRRLLVPALVLALLPACKDKQPEPGQDESAVAVEPGKAASAGSGEAKPDEGPVDQPSKAETGDGGEEEAETGDAGEQEPVPEEFEQVGVASCDDYVARYVACINEKVPEAEREAQRRIVFDNVTAWKQTAAAGGAAEKGLQTGCKIATEQAKRATEAWGCDW